MIDDNSKEFIKRHIGPSEEDQSKMLQYVGYLQKFDRNITIIANGLKQGSYIIKVSGKNTSKSQLIIKQ